MIISVKLKLYFQICIPSALTKPQFSIVKKAWPFGSLGEILTFARRSVWLFFASVTFKDYCSLPTLSTLRS